RAAGPSGHNCPRPFVKVGDDHVHALRGEPFRDPGADPGRTARHQSRQSVEFHGGSVRPGTDIPIRSRLGVRIEPMSAPTQAIGELRGFLHGLPGVDRVGAEGRAAMLASRSIKTTAKQWALDMAISMIDLTTLEGQD